MNATTASGEVRSRPEAMADVPGACELTLTRAVVQYGDVHEVDMPGGRIQDIGLALVLDGRYAASAEVLDLGSATVKMLDLSTELVALDWAYEPTVEHVQALLRARAAEQEDGRELAPYCLQLALRVLERVGFSALTRPTFLRIGFRDICRDLDLHEGTSVRIRLGDRRLTRAHLDYDTNVLIFRTPSPVPDPELEAGLLAAFPRCEVSRVTRTDGAPDVSYHVRLPLPVDLLEARRALATIRRGLADLLARFEPDRFRTVEETLGTFGARETLARLQVRTPAQRVVPLRAHLESSVPATVH
ncbi:MAG: hypothetical protein D6701_00560 [Gemmatimonadetes bacterium]|nr:MAG: hypothetical protein D6701_00560 [Gemmatimonadota bacterium]